MTTQTIRRLAATCAALVVAGAVVAGCGGESSSGGTTTVVVTSGGTTTATPTASPLTLEQRALTASEFTALPIEASEVTDLTGFVDAVSESDDAESDRAILTSAGFTRGLTTSFKTEDLNSYALAFVAEVDAGSAQGVVDQVVAKVSDLSDEPGLTATQFTIDEIPGAKGVEISGTAEGGIPVSGAQVLFADGAYVYGLQMASTGNESVTDDVRNAAIAWHGRVAGAPAAAETTTTPGTTTAPVTTAPGTDTTASDPFPNAEEISLLTHVPAATADNCVRTSEAARASLATASVRCETGDHRVYYEEFGSAEDMRTTYQGYLTANDIERGEGQTCEEGVPAEGTWDGPDNRVVCFRGDGGAWIVWNSTKHNLVAVAIDPSGNVQRLFDWWKSPDSGPIN
ncbi:MAG: hypothetical protein AB7V62_16625 [Thermoleophilia bacterium]